MRRAPHPSDPGWPGHLSGQRVAVHVVGMTVSTARLQVVLTARREKPDSGLWEVPGAFLDPEETLEEAAERIVREILGIDVPLHLEQLGAYDDAKHHPRVRVVSVVYRAVLSSALRIGGIETGRCELVAVEDGPGPRPHPAPGFRSRSDPRRRRRPGTRAAVLHVARDLLHGSGVHAGGSAGGLRSRLGCGSIRELPSQGARNGPGSLPQPVAAYPRAQKAASPP